MFRLFLLLILRLNTIFWITSV